MKTIIILNLMIFYSTAYCQSFSIFDVDESNFPTIKAKFFAFDASGKQITNLSASDFEVRENGQIRNVTLASCPAPKPPQALSSVLVFDVSGSMSDGPPRIKSAKDAANAWVDGIPLGKSECALVSFSDNSMILRDFSTDRQALKNSIEKLVPTNGTNYNQALIDEPCGGLQIAKTGKYKRVIIFLTDGQPNNEPKTSEIIQFAKLNNITIFAVTLDMPAPDCIKDMTLKTGGQYFENITTIKEAQDTYQKLLKLAQGGEPCEIEWQSGISCSAWLTNVTIKLIPQNITINRSYQSPNTSVAKLEFNPTSVKFQNPTPGIKVERKVTVTAKNTNFTITNITSNNAAFEITPKSFILNAGQSRELIVSYIPADSGYNQCKFVIENDVCPIKYYVSGGWKGKKPTIRTLKLIKPNGGEVFVAGSDTVITWEGINPDEPVLIKYSTNNGNIWDTIISKATGLSYYWHVPKTPSNQCLAMVTAGVNISSTCDNPDVEICGKIWMGCNLDVDTYRNGDPIPEVTDPIEWANLTTGAWCYYYNAPENGEVYGKLYNWYAVNDPRGLAPYGWHISTNKEWTELENCLGGGYVAGSKLRSTGTIEEGDGLWYFGHTRATNESGFAALPAGYRDYNGKYSHIGGAACYWSATEDSVTDAWGREMVYNHSGVHKEGYNKVYGFSVRCVRD